MVRSGFRLFPWESARPYWSWSRPAPPIQHSYPVLLPGGESVWLSQAVRKIRYIFHGIGCMPRFWVMDSDVNLWKSVKSFSVVTCYSVKYFQSAYIGNKVEMFMLQQCLPKWYVVAVYHVTIVSMDMGCWRNFGLLKWYIIFLNKYIN